MAHRSTQGPSTIALMGTRTTFPPMKHTRYIHPCTQREVCTTESHLLTSSYIEIGGGTDHFDAPELDAPTDETSDFWSER